MVTKIYYSLNYTHWELCSFCRWEEFMRRKEFKFLTFKYLSFFFCLRWIILKNSFVNLFGIHKYLSFFTQNVDYLSICDLFIIKVSLWQMTFLRFPERWKTFWNIWYNFIFVGNTKYIGLKVCIFRIYQEMWVQSFRKLFILFLWE